MAPHTGSATPEQIDALLNFLDDHRDLARGRLRDAEGNAQAKRLWEELSNFLNSTGGCIKTIQQWQKVWFDRKHLVKKAAADSRRLASVTGGGPLVAPPLSQWQLKVLSIMGDGVGERQTTAVVQAFSETNEPMPSTSSQNQPLGASQPHINLGYLEPEEIDHSTEQPPSSQPVLQEAALPRKSSVPTPSRRRQSAGSDVRRRLYQIEEERAGRDMMRNTELTSIRAELAGIRAASLELIEIIRNTNTLR